MPNVTCEFGTPVNITATADVYTNAATAGPGMPATNKDCSLLGFYVNSTNAGTLVLRKGGSGGTVLDGTITPAIGFHRFPASCPGGLHATIGGSALDVTFFVVPGIA
jgi:hypothetical protein